MRVTDAAGAPLPNAEVVALPAGEPRLADVRGEVRVPWPADGRLRLRVRQIGFRFADLGVVRDSVPAAGIPVRLERVTYVLPAVTAREQTACEGAADPDARARAVPVLEQLQLAAERYEAFRRAYPFRVHIEQRTLTTRPGRRPQLRVGQQRIDARDWGDRYEPGRAIRDERGGWSAPLLFVSVLADPAFWRSHCFAVRGSEPHDGGRALRVAFTPNAALRGPDWSGAVLLDSAASVLRRVEFRLVNRRRGDPERLEGYMTFRSPSPAVVLPDSTVAWWWYMGAPAVDASAPVTGVMTSGTPEVLQLIRVADVVYRGPRPPAPGGAEPPPTP